MKNIIMGKLITRSIFIDGELLRPEESQKVYNHSPDGFNWGFTRRVFINSIRRKLKI